MGGDISAKCMVWNFSLEEVPGMTAHLYFVLFAATVEAGTAEGAGA